MNAFKIDSEALLWAFSKVALLDPYNASSLLSATKNRLRQQTAPDIWCSLPPFDSCSERDTAWRKLRWYRGQSARWLETVHQPEEGEEGWNTRPPNAPSNRRRLCWTLRKPHREQPLSEGCSDRLSLLPCPHSVLAVSQPCKPDVCMGLVLSCLLVLHRSAIDVGWALRIQQIQNWCTWLPEVGQEAAPGSSASKGKGRQETQLPKGKMKSPVSRSLENWHFKNHILFFLIWITRSIGSTSHEMKQQGSG